VAYTGDNADHQFGAFKINELKSFALISSLKGEGICYLTKGTEIRVGGFLKF
jgi:hypothetical protein